MLTGRCYYFVQECKRDATSGFFSLILIYREKTLGLLIQGDKLCNDTAAYREDWWWYLVENRTEWTAELLKLLILCFTEVATNTSNDFICIFDGILQKVTKFNSAVLFFAINGVHCCLDTTSYVMKICVSLGTLSANSEMCCNCLR